MKKSFLVILTILLFSSILIGCTQPPEEVEVPPPEEHPGPETESNVETLLATPPHISGIELTVRMDETSFKREKKGSREGVSLGCHLRSRCTEEFPPELKGKEALTFCGIYQKNDEGTFEHFYSSFAKEGGTHYGNPGGFMDLEHGEYYLFCGIYDCQQIKEVLEEECTEEKTKNVFLNVVPLAFGREEFTVTE